MVLLTYRNYDVRCFICKILIANLIIPYHSQPQGVLVAMHGGGGKRRPLIQLKSLFLSIRNVNLKNLYADIYIHISVVVISNTMSNISK